MRSVWLRRLMIMLLVMTTVGAVVTFGTSSVSTSVEQRNQIVEAEHLADTLDAKIAELTAEVKIRTSPEGALREALCFGPYVEPGIEVYAVVGVDGCVVDHSND